MMLSLFRLEHLGQDHVLIYLIKIPAASPTKGHLSRHKCAPLDIFFPLNSKDYLCDWPWRCDGCGGGGERGIYGLVRIPACLLSTLTAGQISSRHTIWPRHTSTLASAAGAAVSGLVLSPRQENVLLPAVLKVTFVWRCFN